MNRVPWLWAVSLGLIGMAASCDDGDDDDGGPTPPSFSVPAPFAVELSPDGPDQLHAAAAGPGGSFYVAGFAAAVCAVPHLFSAWSSHMPLAAIHGLSRRKPCERNST